MQREREREKKEERKKEKKGKEVSFYFVLLQLHLLLHETPFSLFYLLLSLSSLFSIIITSFFPFFFIFTCQQLFL